MRLIKRTEIQKPKIVYNLHIENDHNYIVNNAIVSNCHRGQGVIIRKLMDMATDVQYRTGWTGSLSNDIINELLVKGLFGEQKQIITTLQLMEKEIVAQLNICIIRLKYKDYVGKQVQILDYHNQNKFIEELSERNEYIAKIAGAINKTGLILYKHIAHGEELFRICRYMYPDRTVYLVHSGHFQRNDEKYKSFEDLKPFIEKDENSIVIAGIQIAGTGISVKNFNFVMFAVPIKSYIATVQAIGRGLRRSNTKNKVLLIDLVDDLSYKGKRVNLIQNYALKHFNERFKIYNENGFNYTIKVHNMQLEHAE